MGKIYPDWFERFSCVSLVYLRVFICILPLNEQQRWKDGEHGHQPRGALWGKGKCRALPSEVKRFVFGEGKTSVGNIRKPFLAVSVDGQISSPKCCRDTEIRKVSSLSSCWSTLRPQLGMVTWAVRSFRCTRHTPALALRATCNREAWRAPHVLKCDVTMRCRSHADLC